MIETTQYPTTSGMPELEPKKSPLGDRNSVLKLVKRWKDFMLSEDTQIRFDKNVDPTKRDMQIRFKETYLEIDNDFMKEMGINVTLHKRMTVHGFIPFVVAFHKDDTEIMSELTGFMDGMVSDKITGGFAPEVSVISMETKADIDISELTVDKSKPLIVLSSSISCPLLKVCMFSGALSHLLKKYKSKAEFLLVYTSEAHPSDGWKLGHKFSCLKQHQNVDDRIKAARLMIDQDAKHFKCLTSDPFNTEKVRVVLDNMNNTFTSSFCSGPIRAFALEDGQLVWMGPNIVHLMSNPQDLMTDKIEAWLRGRFDEEDN
ncbi:thyroxine 5-deiodinase-like isoform X3 [Apostichopus japonicus]|uniref:thyroxine 5-deiodinase-like isoform X3 n=1 Tax=Stichopus japonicus TaxID=307972 RepID=UPI003AB3B164